LFSHIEEAISQSNCRCPLYSMGERNYCICVHICVCFCAWVHASLCEMHCVCICVCVCASAWSFGRSWSRCEQNHTLHFLMSLWSMASSDWSGILRSPGHTPSNNSHLSSWLSAQQAQGKEEERKEEFGWIHFQKLYKAILVCFFLLYIGQCREREQDRFKLFYYLLCNNKLIRIFFLV